MIYFHCLIKKKKQQYLFVQKSNFERYKDSLSENYVVFV